MSSVVIDINSVEEIIGITGKIFVSVKDQKKPIECDKIEFNHITGKAIIQNYR